MIEAINLTKKYGSKEALKNVSFQVDRGEVVGFLGPNGAGKTTAMRILTGYFPPTSGEVRIAGHDIFEDSLKARKVIGYLPENNPLYLDMDVDDFLNYIAWLKGVSKEKKNIQVREKIGICGLDDVKRQKIKSLSKGYKQRVGIAQALLGNPEVLIMDEPTIGLDPKQIIEIRELIKNLGKEKTIILSSHILPEVSVTCSRVIIISNGEIVAEDTPDNLENKVSGAAKVLVTARGAKDEILNKLGTLEGVEEIEAKKEHGNNMFDFEIKSQKDRDIRGSIARSIVQSNWDLLEMRRETLGLEEIFLKLTTKEK